MDDHPGLHDEWLDSTVGHQFGGSPIDLKPVSAALEPGEAVLWVGRPFTESVFRRSLSGVSDGPLALGFALFWAVEVIRGGSNNWDRGRPCRPSPPTTS